MNPKGINIHLEFPVPVQPFSFSLTEGDGIETGKSKISNREKRKGWKMVGTENNHS